MSLRFLRSFRVPAFAGVALSLLAACGDSPVASSAPEPSLFPGGHLTSTGPAAPTVTILWQDLAKDYRSLWLTSGGRWDGQYAALPQMSSAWSMAAYGDITGDGIPDIVAQNTQTGERAIWYITATQWSLQTVALPTIPTEWSIAGMGDFDGDGKADLVWQNTRTGERALWFMNGARFEGRVAALPQVSTDWRIAAVGDFNGDGHPDLVWQYATWYVSIWLMNGSTWSGTYAALPPVPVEWRIAAASDFDGDARPDLLWQNTQTGERVVWFMSGSTWNGAYAILPTVATSWSIVGAAVAPNLSAPAGDAVAPSVSVTGVADGSTYASAPVVSVGATDDVALAPVPLLVSVRRTAGGTSSCASSAQLSGGVLGGIDPAPTAAACPTLSVTMLASNLFAQAGSYTLVIAATDRAGNVSAPRTISFVVGAH